MGIKDSWHGARDHDPTVRMVSRPLYQFRSERYRTQYALVSNFETLGDWVNAGGEAQTADTTNFKEGSQGIKWTSINAVATVADRTIGLNALGEHFELWVYIDDFANLNQFMVYFQVGGGWATHFRITYTSAYGGIKAGWNKLSLSRANFTAAGGVVSSHWANITAVRIRVESKAGVTVNLTFDDFRMVQDCFAGKVMLRFDDGLASAYTEARRRMDAYGFRGLVAVPIKNIGVSGYMTLEQLKLLQERGWDIVSHTISHAHLDASSDVQAEAELSQSQRWLIENGFMKGSRFIVPPFYEWRVHWEKIKKYYLGCQTLSQFWEALPPADEYRMIAQSAIDPTTPLATVQGWIDAAKVYQAWLTLFFHEISGMTALFQNIIDYVYASGLEVVTLSDVFDDTIVKTALQTNVLSPTLAVDSVGLKTVTIPHGLGFIPDKQDITLTIVENTAVDDWRFDLLKLVSVGAANVVVKINVCQASATAGATAKIGLRVGKP